jgi:hypothetical protein
MGKVEQLLNDHKAEELRIYWAAGRMVATLEENYEKGGDIYRRDFRGEGENVEEALEALVQDIERVTSPEASDIYAMAKEIVESESQWYSGQARTVWEGNGHRVVVTEYGRDGGGLLGLQIRNGHKSELVQCGFLNILETNEWEWTLTRDEYQEWVERAQRRGAAQVAAKDPNRTEKAEGGRVTYKDGKAFRVRCDRCHKAGLPDERHGKLYCLSCGNLIAGERERVRA